MVSRLVLGGGPVVRRVAGAAAEGGDGVRVVAEDLSGSPVDADVAVERADPSDPSVLEGYAPDVVLVTGVSADRTLSITRTARETFPDATLIAYAGPDATDRDVADMQAIANRVIEVPDVVGEGVADVVASPSGLQARKLRRTLRTIDGPLAIVTHDNPDPDAIASAVALVRIAGAVGVEATPCYYGEISHQENRAMVNVLDLDLRRLAPDDDLSEFEGFALVDHSRPGVNDQLPPDLVVDVVIDHHPPREPVESDFVDLRSEVGATSTLLTTYLQRFGIDDFGGWQVATALLYGIRVDTSDFTREVTAADFEAAAALLPSADTDLLDRVEDPAVSGDTMDTLGRAIRNREVRGSVLASCVGPINDRDALAQAADRLLDMGGITATLVYGYYERDRSDSVAGADGTDAGVVYCSARARGTSLDLGETLRTAFDDFGSAGGHADMAGAQIPLESLGDHVLEREGEARMVAVRDLVSGIFFDVVHDYPYEIPSGTGGPEIESPAVPTAWDLDDGE